MSVGVLILTEDGTGVLFHHHLRRVDEEDPLNIMTLTINHEMTAEVLQPHLEQRIEQLDTGGGVLILLDDFHAILPAILDSLRERFYLRVLTGVNQAMLNTIVEHSDADLDALARFALNGARQAVQIAYSSDGGRAEE